MSRAGRGASIRPVRTRRQMGTAGERRAAGYLQRRGWTIAGRNVRVAGVEIDILATRAGLLVAVEVKTRSGDTGADLALSAAQRRRLAGAVQSLAARRPALAPRGVRVDLITAGPHPWSAMRWIADVTAAEDHSPQAASR